MFSGKEYSVFMSALKSNLTLTNVGILLTACTGIRLGELRALKWSDIDFEDNIVSIKQTIQRITNFSGHNSTKVIITSPKSRTSTRKIPVPQWLMQILITAKIRSDGYILTGSSEFVVKIVKLNASFKLKFDRKSCIQFYKRSDLMYIESRLYGS